MEPMSCEKARSLFDQKLDGELDTSENAQLEAHFATCETCRREYEQLKKIKAYLGTFAVDVPPELSASVTEHIKKEPKRRAAVLRRLRPLVALPVAALLCLAVIHSPLVDGMFAAKSEADMMDMPEASINNADGTPLYNGTGSENPKHDGKLEDAAEPQEEQIEVKQVYAIADTDLVLLILNETEALICRDTGAETAEMLLSVTYMQKENEFILKANGKKLFFRLQNEILTPTDKAALDALLSE